MERSVPWHDLERRRFAAIRLHIGACILWALGSMGCGSETKNVRFEGKDIAGGGLSVRADPSKSSLVISSSSRRFSVSLPYAEDWKIESNDEAALFAESSRLHLTAYLSDDHAGAADFQEETALLLNLYLSSKAFGKKAEPGGIKKENGILVLEATFKAGGEMKEEIFLAASARQAPWQRGPEYRTLVITLKSPRAGLLTSSQAKELALQDFRSPSGR